MGQLLDDFLEFSQLVFDWLNRVYDVVELCMSVLTECADSLVEIYFRLQKFLITLLNRCVRKQNVDNFRDWVKLVILIEVLVFVA